MIKIEAELIRFRDSRSTTWLYLRMYSSYNSSLLLVGAEIDARDFVSGWTPLLRCAAMSSNVMAGGALIELGADIDACDKESKTPLMMAAIKTNFAFGKLLLGESVPQPLLQL